MDRIDFKGSAPVGMASVPLLAAALLLTSMLLLVLTGPAVASTAGFASQVRAAERRAVARLAATERATPPGRYAYYTAGGSWKFAKARCWASGYVPGGLWLAYQLTGKDWRRRHASSRQAAIGASPITADSLNLGALFFPELRARVRRRPGELQAARRRRGARP